ncbi:ArsC family reductase [Sphingobacterium sp. SRCM116780]|uniref:ArsC family reductase n=1 Tax=Sphingobacterium sp. SRCM116780 TaxID=2907623 RepID=UPI001F1D6454|nr:ArsC family reductase [Sphingobacterium sp. SRCM116780]UIR57201.1 ArsC family reductase [Sphingobacterium sp. SRCM116780]
MLQVYGIKNCNTVKKALNWLEENQIAYIFHDFKKEGISEKQLQDWEKQISWEKLLNKKGTTWKKLDAEEQATVMDATSANQVLIQHTSMIKRPVIEGGKQIIVGFDENEYASFLK